MGAVNPIVSVSYFVHRRRDVDRPVQFPVEDCFVEVDGSVERVDEGLLAGLTGCRIGDFDASPGSLCGEKSVCDAEAVQRRA